MIVYKITNLVNNKIYIGQTIDTLQRRWNAHCKRTARLTYIRKAILKHGKENFIVEQIDSAETLEELNKKERKWIAFYNATNNQVGYNLESGGLNKKVAESTRFKISKAHKGKQLTPMTEEIKNKISQANKGKVRSVEFRTRLSELSKGRIVSEETRRKVGEARRNRVHPPVTEQAKLKMKLAQQKRREREKLEGVA